MLFKVYIQLELSFMFSGTEMISKWRIDHQKQKKYSLNSKFRIDNMILKSYIEQMKSIFYDMILFDWTELVKKQKQKK